MNDYDLYDTRLDYPPEKLITIAVCPECGCDELGQIVVRDCFERIYDWEDGEPYTTEDDGEQEFKDFGDPRYYCCNCGEGFDQPEFREEYG
jgi:hypothetical protein